MTATKFSLRDYEVIVSPLLTEKSTQMTQFGHYFFEVSTDATKPEIKGAVERLFGVKVKSVNTSVRKGKTRRFKGREGIQSDKKRAMVCLESGQTIDFSNGVR